MYLISLSKSSFMVFVPILVMITYWNSSFIDLSVTFSYISIASESFPLFDFGFNFGGVGFFFLFMVFLVTSFVASYSGVYMEHYENTKFIFFLVSFFVSMLLVSFSSSNMTLMMGWDGLGITSICLIMFYPNSNTLFNTVLTMFFNRLGDVILILALGLSVYSVSILSEVAHSGPTFFLLMILCSFTKSAQFPLSSWLPAAMSAPTPISAMVHSSTLVTAGLFVCLYYYPSFWYYNLMTLFLFFGMSTFIVGGLSANMEKDLKKIVAFSTMSQISMVFCFVSMGFLILGCFHMIFHAFFKTLLFCVSGLIFMTNFSDQLKKSLGSFSLEKGVKYLLFLSLFGMTGLTYSSSFFSKDRLLETAFFLNDVWSPLILFVGSVLTLSYCSSLFLCLSDKGSSKNLAYSKEFSHSSFFLFSLLVIVFPFTFCPTLLESFPLLDFSICVMLLSFFLAVTCFSISFFRKLSSSFSFFISGMKFFSYTYFGKLFDNNNVAPLVVSSDLFVNSKNFPTKSFSKYESWSKSPNSFYTLLVILILLSEFF